MPYLQENCNERFCDGGEKEQERVRWLLIDNWLHSVTYFLEALDDLPFNDLIAALLLNKVFQIVNFVS